MHEPIKDSSLFHFSKYIIFQLKAVFARVMLCLDVICWQKFGCCHLLVNDLVHDFHNHNLKIRVLTHLIKPKKQTNHIMEWHEIWLQPQGYILKLANIYLMYLMYLVFFFIPLHWHMILELAYSNVWQQRIRSTSAWSIIARRKADLIGNTH